MSILGSLFAMNLRVKIIVPIAAMLISAMLIVSGYLIERQSEGYLRELNTSGETMIRMLALNAEGGVLFHSSYELDELLSVLSNFKTLEYAAIYDADNVILAQIGLRNIDTTKIGRKHQSHEIDQPVSHSHSNTLQAHYYFDFTDNEILLLSAPIITRKLNVSREQLGITGKGADGNANVQTSTVIGRIELALTVEIVNQKVSESRVLAVLLTLIVVLACIYILTLIVNAVTRPITQLVNITDEIGRGKLDQRLHINRRDEIGHLARTFNTMIESLRQSRAEVELHHRTLEDKIRERTVQLDEAQSQLIQTEKMSAIGQLAAGVAHELNNPLGGILGYAQFTLEKLRKNTPEKTTTKEIEGYRKYVTDIEIQARRCKAIVQNLLRFARSSKTIDIEKVDINIVINETISFTEHQLQISQIELQTELAKDLPSISGNAGQLQQVFTNLIINGMHATEPGGVITIITRVSPALGEFGGAVEVIIADTGHGIPKEHIGKIFEPFFTTKEVGKGTGLGLSVSYGIIKEHSGEITAASSPGNGTTFTIILPVQNLAQSADKDTGMKQTKHQE